MEHKKTVKAAFDMFKLYLNYCPKAGTSDAMNRAIREISLFTPASAAIGLNVWIWG